LAWTILAFFGENWMQIAVSEAKAQLLELVRRAESGEEVILMRHGQAIARLVGMAPDKAQRRAVLDAVRGAARGAKTTAARSQDFLYDEHGLPG
jgi:prevent-host-death family protein